MRKRSEPTASYRQSHTNRGDGYDDTLTRNPFDAYMAVWEARHVREFVRQAFPNGLGRYLDFACGTGRLTQVIGAMASETVGVDVAPSMLAVARTKVPRATFVEADLTRRDVDLGSFDLASAFRFFGNAEPELRRAALAALAAHLRPGGCLLVNNHRNPLAILNMLARLGGADAAMDLTFAKLKGLLNEAGFEIRGVRSIAVWQFRPALTIVAGQHPQREQMLEKMFSSRVWATIAPDVVILAGKVATVTGKLPFPIRRIGYRATSGTHPLS